MINALKSRNSSGFGLLHSSVIVTSSGNPWYNQYHPAVLRLIQTIIENGHQEGIWVGMCGEMAGDPKLIPVLLGMGLDEFSMSSNSILAARWIINHLSKKDMEDVVNKVINLPTASEVQEYLYSLLS